MPHDPLTQRLDTLLAEPREVVLEREQTALDREIGGMDAPFVLFGAGHLGRKVLRKLATIGKRPLAFIDNNPKLWGTEVHGLPVMSPADAASRYDPGYLGVITTIWCGEATDKMSDRINPLRALGFSRIALFGHLAWKFKEEFLPHYCLDSPSKVIDAAESVRQAFALMSDETSRQLFVDHIEWRLFLDYDLLPPPSNLEIYFNKHFVSHCATEVLYDIGAYTGDSVEDFLRSERGSQFSEIHSFEPSPNNFLKLEAYLHRLQGMSGKTFPHQMALGDVQGSIAVEEDNGPASRVGVGSLNVPMTTIDEFSRMHTAPTFIKIDIEGFEPSCLQGAEHTIRRSGPVVAVCVYHLQAHLWEIALQLHTYNPTYRFFLCPHLADGWDLVLYAVPASRIPN
jgi:FkbM family methyltransferase